MKPEELAEIVAKAIKPLVDQVKSQAHEITSLKSDIATIKAIPAPKDGKDVDMASVKAMIIEAVSEIPKPKDGKDVDMAAVKAMIEEAVSAIPKPKDGKDADMDAVKNYIQEAVKSIPVINGKDGKDGIGLAGAMIDREGELKITLSNGEVKGLGVVVGKNGENGKAGSDGISFDDFGMEYISETHEIEIRATAAGKSKTFRYPAGGIRPGGYWRSGAKADKGSAWHDAGNLYIALKDTSSRPSLNSMGENPDWMLAARRGKDGETIVKHEASDFQPIKLNQGHKQ